LRTDLLEYDLPERLVAQHPAPRRRDARLMTLSRATGEIGHRVFSELPFLLRRGDLLVVNDTKVLHGRLRAVRATGGAVEVFLLSPLPEAGAAGEERWEALARPSKRLKAGEEFEVGDALRVRLARRLDEGRWEVLLSGGGVPVAKALERAGDVPLPPYIRRSKGDPAAKEDAVRYQTVFAKNPGSVAAPTAGLHFTDEVFDLLRGRAVGIAPVTLHVGYGTFLPIEAENVEDHIMEEEHFTIDGETARLVNGAKRVIAVGTTSTRVLESVADDEGKIRPVSGSTRLYLYPGGRFRRVDALLTNFHLPKSSLFLLVCAFAGRERMQETYRIAIENRFRFYSYGDCMLIL